MRIALVLVSLCLVLSLGALGLFMAFAPSQVPGAVDAPASPRMAVATPADVDGPQNQSDEILARMDALAREVDELHAEIAALKAGAEREPAAAIPAEASVEESDTATYAAVHRDAILKVIEDDRVAQQKKREEEQRARDMEAMLARAERTAKRFGLNADQQKSLADVYLLERTKMQDMRTQMREQGGFVGDPEQMRTSFQELREWRLQELSTRLGPDLGQQINDADSDRFRDASGGGGGRRFNRAQNGGDGANGNPGGGGF